MAISVDAAQADLPALIEAARNGEDVVITQAAVPMVKLVPVPPRRRFKMGILPQGALGEGPDFFEPMSEADLALWEGGS